MAAEGKSGQAAANWSLERIVPAEVSLTRKVLEEIIECLSTRTCPCGDLDEIKIALEEAFANAIQHGCGMNPEKKILVRCRWDASEGLTITVRDQGRGFCPDNLPDPTDPENLEQPSGRGVYLIRQLMDEVEFRHGGCEVWMRRRPRSQTNSE